MKDVEEDALRYAIREVGHSYEFLTYDCDEDPDDMEGHNPSLLDATRVLQDFAYGNTTTNPDYCPF